MMASKTAAATDWGNPPGAHWTQIPASCWADNVDLMRCYHKGSTGGYSGVFEIGRSCDVVNSYCGSGSGFSNHSGSYGDTNSGSFNNANRPTTALFTVDWTGAGTSYTASPYDPA